MAFVTQIQLNTKGYLDISDNINVPLNYSVAEIQDISKKQGGYSKTIILPGTANNNTLLGNLFDVNIIDSSFNQNIKEQCSVLQNGVPVINGYIQLLNVKKLSSGQGGLDDFITYEVAIKDNTGDFYSSLDGGFLTDFDFSQYNHTYVLSAITATQNNTWEDVYKYHMFYNLKDYYEIQDFKPNIFAKVYWDKIFNACGYTYEWDSISEVGFDKMIIPWNGDTDLSNVDDLLFRVGWSGSTGYIIGNNTTPINTSTQRYRYWTFNNTFNDDTIDLNDNTNGLFNLTNQIYTSNYYGSNTLESKYYYEIYYYTSQALSLNNLNPGPTHSLTIDAQQQYWQNPSAVYPSKVDCSPFFQKTYQIGDSLPIGYTLISSGVTGVNQATFNMIPGDTFKAFVKANERYDNSVWKNGGGTMVSPQIVIKLGVNPTNQVDNYFRDAPAATVLGQGRLLDVNKFIPKQIKWKDYISGVVKLFNLYLTPDPDKDNHIIIQTRDDFYDSGASIDWTQKIDLSKENKIQFLPDLQNKDILFTYKTGADIWNQNYVRATSEIYGQLRYTFENQFVQSEKKIETLFEATPITETYVGGGYNIVSAIDTVSPKVSGLKILYDNGWLIGNDWIFNYKSGHLSGTTTFDGTTQGYPTATHFYPNPINPTDDLNFGQTDYLYYNDWETLTNNNLYNKYYHRFVKQIETGKLLTAYFYLTEYDILNLDFRNKIWILDSYWYLNKIIDYNANDNLLTKVELINVEDDTLFEPTNNLNHQKIAPSDFPEISNSGIQSTLNNMYGGTVVGVNVMGSDNIIQNNSRTAIIGGDYNNVSSSKSFLFGDNNNIVSNDSILIGDNNNGNSDRSFIIGSNHQELTSFNSIIYGDNLTGVANNSQIYGNNVIIPSGITNVFIIGDDVTANDSNSLFCPNIVLASGGIIKSDNMNLHSGDAFNTTDITLIPPYILQMATEISSGAQSIIVIEPNAGIELTANDGIGTIGDIQILPDRIIMTTPTSSFNLGPSETTIQTNSNPFTISGLSAFADDVAAGVGGLTTSQIYMTDGTGAAPLNVAGILMIKQ